MSKEEKRHYILDGDTIIVDQVYDSEIGQYRNDYPDFETNPRLTPTGRQWVSVFKDDCPYSSSEYGDCGSCKYFRSEKQGDLIGVCDNDKLIVSGFNSTFTEPQRKEA